MGVRHHVLTASAAGLSVDIVRVKAQSELIERIEGVRHCYEPFSPELTGVSYKEIATEALSPAIFLKKQSARYTLDLSDMPLNWREVVNVDGSPLLIPAQIVDYFSPSMSEMLLRIDSTGLAAHPDMVEAKRHALLEVIERHACITSWRNTGLNVRKTSVPQTELVQIASRLNYSIMLYQVMVLGFPATALALLINGAGITVGSCCSDDEQVAAESAIIEALTLRDSLTKLGTPREGYDPLNPTTSLEHVAAAYQRTDEIVGWYESQTLRIPSGDDPLYDRKKSTFQPLYADLSGPTAKKLGLNVVRAIVPEIARKEWDHQDSNLQDPNSDNPSPHPFA